MINNEPNNRSGSSAGDLLHDNTNQYSIDYFADEIFINILSYLNLAQINNLSLVNKKWKRLTRDPNLLKIAIYREIAFGMDKWVQNFGEKMMNDIIKLDGNQDASSPPLDEFMNDCRKFEQVFPGERASDHLSLVWLPQEFTTNKIGELIKNYFPENKDGYEKHITRLGDVPPRSGWVIATKGIFPGSKGKSYEEQMELLDQLAEKGLADYRPPMEAEAAGCILAQYLEERKNKTAMSSSYGEDEKWAKICERLLELAAEEEYPISAKDYQFIDSKIRNFWLNNWNWAKVFTRCVDINGQDECTGKDMHRLVGRFKRIAATTKIILMKWE